MNKTLFLILYILALASALTMSHNDQKPHPKGPASPKPPKLTPEQQAQGRLLKFIQKNPSLISALQPGAQLTQEQLSLLTNWMAKDKFFQQQLIDTLVATEENSWLKGVSKKSQQFYLEQIVSLMPHGIEDEKQIEGVVKKLLGNKEIAKALKEKYGDDADFASLLAQSSQGLASGAIPAHLATVMHLNGRL